MKNAPADAIRVAISRFVRLTREAGASGAVTSFREARKAAGQASRR